MLIISLANDNKNMSLKTSHKPESKISSHPVWRGFKKKTLSAPYLVTRAPSDLLHATYTSIQSF